MLPCGVCCDASVFILQIYEANGEVLIWLVETFYSRECSAFQGGLVAEVMVGNV